MKILLVDDNDSVRLTTSIILEEAGHEVIEGSTLEEGRALIAGGEYDLLILDLHLDTGLGTELIPDHRRLWPRTPVVILSGSAGEEYVGGADALFDKGGDPDRLVALLEELITQSK